uniref:Uncharacterized protein n=1 Tax=Anguilla anguilla TaxID=7936 RepID=A0A0E9TU35_ANGAN
MGNVKSHHCEDKKKIKMKIFNIEGKSKIEHTIS